MKISDFNWNFGGNLRFSRNFSKIQAIFNLQQDILNYTVDSLSKFPEKYMKLVNIAFKFKEKHQICKLQIFINRTLKLLIIIFKDLNTNPLPNKLHWLNTFSQSNHPSEKIPHSPLHTLIICVLIEIEDI